MKTHWHRLPNPNQFWVEIFFSGPAGHLKAVPFSNRAASYMGHPYAETLARAPGPEGITEPLNLQPCLAPKNWTLPSPGGFFAHRQTVEAQLLFELLSMKLLAGKTRVWVEKLTYQLTKGEITWLHRRPQEQSDWDNIVRDSSTDQFTLQ